MTENNPKEEAPKESVANEQAKETENAEVEAASSEAVASETQAKASEEGSPEGTSEKEPVPATETASEDAATVQAEAAATSDSENGTQADTAPAAAEPIASESPAKKDPEPAKADAAESQPAAKAEPAKAKPAVAESDTDASDSGDEDEEEGQGQSFEELLEQYDKFREYRPGELVEGTIVSIGEMESVVDIGARVEGVVATSEFKDAEGALQYKEGDKIKIMVLRFNPEGQHIPLSFERARVSKVWDEIEELANNNEHLEGSVIEKVKGGFIVDVGVRAFLPTSQATLKPQKDYQDLLGKRFKFAILKIQRRRGNLILSRKDILQVEHESLRKELFEKLTEGAVLKGTVKNITDYGAFIDLGGLDGLLHISDMSWGRINHPKDLVEMGDELEVKVLRFDPEKEKVSLGLKQCTPDPWLSVSEKYPPGASVKGKVLNLTSYGAFVELEPGVEGMVHVSELSWTKKVRNPAQVLNKDEEVSVRVLDLDSDKRRVSLSLKQTEDNPWESLAERFPVGSKVVGKVRNITEFGAFIEIEEGIDGLVHVSDFKWGERNADPNEFVKKGDELEVVVLAVDTENHKVSLGMKQLSQDPWIQFTKSFKEGQILNAPISRIADFGVFLQLDEHVEGLVRRNELDLDAKQKPADVYKEGDEVQVLLSRISHRERKVDLSVRKVKQRLEREAVMEYTRENNQGGATMADIMGQELKKLVR